MTPDAPPSAEGRSNSTRQKLYRQLPQVGELLSSPAVCALVDRHGHARTASALRQRLAELRVALGAGELTETSLATALNGLAALIEQRLQQQREPKLRRVLNATGVLLQTNLGRAPLSEAALAHVVEVAGGYSNLEFDLEAGERGRRGKAIEQLLLSAAGVVGSPLSYDALIVNNCAAATFLALSALAPGGEVVVSRGELVEIGGGFRIPEILALSGAVLREVGTTNRTRVSDYAAALTPQTRLILRVHRSNFSIEGFTEQPTLRELVDLGRRASVPVFDDQGTGCLIDLHSLDVEGQGGLRESLATGVSLVAASGDKLMGGPQAGLLLGEAEIISRLRSHPLFRAFRVDKLTYAALEATLWAYLEDNLKTLPLMRFLYASPGSLQARCEACAAQLEAKGIAAEVVSVRSVVGGGTTPGATLPSFALGVRPAGQTETALAARLRVGRPPVITRIQAGQVLLDLRAIGPADDPRLVEALVQASSDGSAAETLPR